MKGGNVSRYTIPDDDRLCLMYYEVKLRYSDYPMPGSAAFVVAGDDCTNALLFLATKMVSN